jgi:uncharacterized protein (DUF2062 family)
MQRHVPCREQLERNRWVRPFAHHLLRPELWRLTRRSVPRGVALGLFVGVMIPLAHFVVAAFIAILIRANIPAAMLATFIGFPVIYVGLLAAAAKIGGLLLRVDAITASEPITQVIDSSGIQHWLHRAMHLAHWVEGKGPSVILGLFVIASALSLIGYFGSSVFWRWWIGRKWRSRTTGTAHPQVPA